MANSNTGIRKHFPLGTRVTFASEILPGTEENGTIIAHVEDLNLNTNITTYSLNIQADEDTRTVNFSYSDLDVENPKNSYVVKIDHPLEILS